jgi:hypothetical protein
MKKIIISAALALTISAPLTACKEDEKQGAKDVVREFLAEEKTKAQSERERFLKGRGEGQSYPANPFGLGPKTTKQGGQASPQPHNEISPINRQPQDTMQKKNME